MGAEHTLVHAPAEHTCPAAQARPQTPQLALLVLRLVSQPLAALPSQLPKPGLQLATVHAPAAQPAVALASEQAAPQAPQCAGVTVTLVSQPLAALPSQLP